MKALEDLSSRYDRSVRNATGGVVQFVYGDDGLDLDELDDATGSVPNRTVVPRREVLQCLHETTSHVIDPANLEGDGKPVVFDRTWSHARVSSLETAIVQTIRVVRALQHVVPNLVRQETFGARIEVESLSEKSVSHERLR
jgi:hypothetical protein